LKFDELHSFLILQTSSSPNKAACPALSHRKLNAKEKTELEVFVARMVTKKGYEKMVARV